MNIDSAVPYDLCIVHGRGAKVQRTSGSGPALITWWECLQCTAAATPTPTCEGCGSRLENPLNLAGPYCVNRECSKRGSVILPPLDLALRVGITDGKRTAYPKVPEPEPTELDRAHATIRRLNRRVQSAESGLAEKINANAGPSLGRAFANAAATMYAAQLEDLRGMLPTAAEARLCLHALQVGGYAVSVTSQLVEKLRRMAEVAG